MVAIISFCAFLRDSLSLKNLESLFFTVSGSVTLVSVFVSLLGENALSDFTDGCDQTVSFSCVLCYGWAADHIVANLLMVLQLHQLLHSFHHLCFLVLLQPVLSSSSSSLCCLCCWSHCCIVADSSIFVVVGTF